MRLDPKYVEMEREITVKSTVEWIDNVVMTFERAAREAASYKERFEIAAEETRVGKSGACRPEEVLSWLVNSTCNPAPNLRLDMAVTHGARLSEAYSKVKELRDRTAADEVSERTTNARWMLTAHRTLQPTLKSARTVTEKGLRPDIVHLGTFEACYERARRLNGGRMNADARDVMSSAGRLPVVVTDVWTYHVVEIAAMDDARV